MSPELHPVVMIKSAWKYLSNRDQKLMRFYNSNFVNSPISDSQIDTDLLIKDDAVTQDIERNTQNPDNTSQ